jgi:hypothetical protein
MTSRVIHLASIHGFLHALLTVLICILLVAAELFVAELLAAPRWVTRKLLALLPAPARLARRHRRPATQRQVSARVPREGV